MIYSSTYGRFRCFKFLHQAGKQVLLTSVLMQNMTFRTLDVLASPGYNKTDTTTPLSYLSAPGCLQGLGLWRLTPLSKI